MAGRAPGPAGLPGVPQRGYYGATGGARAGLPGFPQRGYQGLWPGYQQAPAWLLASPQCGYQGLWPGYWPGYQQAPARLPAGPQPGYYQAPSVATSGFWLGPSMATRLPWPGYQPGSGVATSKPLARLPRCPQHGYQQACSRAPVWLPGYCGLATGGAPAWLPAGPQCGYQATLAWLLVGLWLGCQCCGYWQAPLRPPGGLWLPMARLPASSGLATSGHAPRPTCGVGAAPEGPSSDPVLLQRPVLGEMEENRGLPGGLPVNPRQWPRATPELYSPPSYFIVKK